MFGLTAALRALFTGITSYLNAFANTGKVAEQVSQSYLEESTLEHQRKMAALRAKAAADADPIDIN